MERRTNGEKTSPLLTKWDSLQATAELPGSRAALSAKPGSADSRKGTENRFFFPGKANFLDPVCVCLPFGCARAFSGYVCEGKEVGSPPHCNSCTAREHDTLFWATNERLETKQNEKSVGQCGPICSRSSFFSQRCSPLLTT